MKYDKSKIMKNAWATYKHFQKFVNPLSFSVCLSRAWAAEKKAIAKAAREVEAEKAIRYEVGKRMSDAGAVFMKPAVIAEAGRMGWVLSGKTYAARKEIKAMGFRFDCEVRNWYTQDKAVAVAFAMI